MKTEGPIRASVVDYVTLALVIIGGLNWGLIGIGHFVDEAANWNVVNIALGEFPAVEAAVYLLVGLAALYELYFAYQLYTVSSGRREHRGASGGD